MWIVLLHFTPAHGEFDDPFVRNKAPQRVRGNHLYAALTASPKHLEEEHKLSDEAEQPKDHDMIVSKSDMLV